MLVVHAQAAKGHSKSEECGLLGMGRKGPAGPATQIPAKFVLRLNIPKPSLSNGRSQFLNERAKTSKWAGDAVWSTTNFRGPITSHLDCCRLLATNARMALGANPNHAETCPVQMGCCCCWSSSSQGCISTIPLFFKVHKIQMFLQQMHEPQSNSTLLLSPLTA